MMGLPSRFRSICAIVSIAAMLLSMPAFASSPSLVPGKQAGSLKIKSYPKGLPMTNPDYSDGAMGQYVSMWVSNERDKAGLPLNTLVPRFVSNGFSADAKPGDTVVYVRVTSSVFHDAHGLSTGSTLASIERIYPHLKPVDDKPTVLADDALGIAFEFGEERPTSASKCIAISIYDKGGQVAYNAVDVRGMLKDWKSGYHGR